MISLSRSHFLKESRFQYFYHQGPLSMGDMQTSYTLDGMKKHKTWPPFYWDVTYSISIKKVAKGLRQVQLDPDLGGCEK